MQRVGLLLGAASLFVVAAPGTAQQADTTALTVTQLVVATGVENREPVGAAERFAPDVGTLYCYMAVEGDAPETQLTQVWTHDDQEMARVPLTVRGPRWRTWSSKKIAPSWTGAWTVTVVDDAGNTLKSVAFAIGGGQ